ncbi:MAG TPA: hypothetical protein PLO33_17740 [Kouleothrix sp.]|uniref:hypothetical protein n=1 Tax=Kouleothrix sp. TaxID=2779161 RepID=UPI002C0FCA0E|nr:hypothetical protein [Kouleothrix sp.]HRC77531.1 hypothetical protein [Kouleothrix sp.]
MPARQPAKRSNHRVVASKIVIGLLALTATIGGGVALNRQSEPLVQRTVYAVDLQAAVVPIDQAFAR